MVLQRPVQLPLMHCSLAISFIFLVLTWGEWILNIRSQQACFKILKFETCCGQTRESIFFDIVFLFSGVGLVPLLVGIFWFTNGTTAGQALNQSPEDDFKEGDRQKIGQHLQVRCGGQLLYLTGEDGGHHQHDNQVHSNGVAKEVFVKENGCEGDEEQENGGG